MNSIRRRLSLTLALVLLAAGVLLAFALRDFPRRMVEEHVLARLDHDADLLPVIEALLDELIRSTRRRLSVRLVGVKLSHLAPGSHRQMRLDEGAEYDKRSALYAAADAIRARHGFDAISSARACHERKRPANFRTRHPDAEP